MAGYQPYPYNVLAAIVRTAIVDFLRPDPTAPIVTADDRRRYRWAIDGGHLVLGVNVDPDVDRCLREAGMGVSYRLARYRRKAHGQDALARLHTLQEVLHGHIGTVGPRSRGWNLRHRPRGGPRAMAQEARAAD